MGMGAKLRSSAAEASRPVVGRIGHAAALGLVTLSLATLLSGCSLRQYAVNMVGDMLADGGTVYESDDDIILVGEALPFSIKLLETLVEESPRNPGLLIATSRAYVLYAYAYVQHRAELVAPDNIKTAKVYRDRARRLYMRAYGYAIRALELSYPGIEARLTEDPQHALAEVGERDTERAVATLYWTAASLGLAISVARHEPALLARLPEVGALLERALTLDESWDSGTLHEFAVVWAGAPRAAVQPETVQNHYERALALSGGTRASVYVAYAESVLVPAQNRAEFVALMDKALAVDIESDPDHRLVNALAKRRALWLLERTDELILE
jgi:predicted anti-sigma-YlaC factor YlaD